MALSFNAGATRLAHSPPPNHLNTRNRIPGVLRWLNVLKLLFFLLLRLFRGGKPNPHQDDAAVQAWRALLFGVSLSYVLALTLIAPYASSEQPSLRLDFPIVEDKTMQPCPTPHTPAPPPRPDQTCQRHKASLSQFETRR
eukprot:555008-Rhodomonas_salina.1